MNTVVLEVALWVMATIFIIIGYAYTQAKWKTYTWMDKLATYLYAGLWVLAWVHQSIRVWESFVN